MEGWKERGTDRLCEWVLVHAPVFERRILRIIYGHINDNGIWRTRYNNELYTLYDELDVVKVTKIGRLRCLGHFCRMQTWTLTEYLLFLNQKVLDV